MCTTAKEPKKALVARTTGPAKPATTNGKQVATGPPAVYRPAATTHVSLLGQRLSSLQVRQWGRALAKVTSPSQADRSNWLTTPRSLKSAVSRSRGPV